MSKVDEQLVDPARLGSFLSERLSGDGELRVERHVAGHSNETFYVFLGDRSWVLRRPPLAVYLPTAHDVLREFRVLDALSGTNVRVPKVELACDDGSVIGAPFYLMEKVEGVVIRDAIPDHLDNSSDHRLVGEQLVRALVELHEVDPAQVGLDTLGKPSGYLERQVRRWSGQLELATSITSQSRQVPQMWAVRDWLANNIPVTHKSVIVHGDYKLDNVMFASDSPARLNAILDWEMSTIGDPLADLGWMLSFWREDSDPDDPLHSGLAKLTVGDGFMVRRELVELYAGLSGNEVHDLEWYVVAGVWKLACLLEGSYGRHLMGTTDDPFFAMLESGVPALADRAMQIAEGGMNL